MTWIAHEACPECRSRGKDTTGDNLGVHEDGHKFCFSCGYFLPANKIIQIGDIRDYLSNNKRRDEDATRTPDLPGDYSTIIPLEPLVWLRSYDISADEIAKHKIGWSTNLQRLIFPIFGEEGQLLMWQGRFFPASNLPGVRRAKYFTCGHPDEIQSFFGKDDAGEGLVVVVEDVVSAIKVARVKPSMCLWGSELSLKKFKRISQYFKHLVIWLDSDKESYQIRSGLKARPYFEAVSQVFTEKDPKSYTTSEIEKWISYSLKK